MRKEGNDDAANDEAMANSVSKSESGYYGAASWWPDGMGVVIALSGGGLSTLAYSSDPVNYINSILPVYGKEILDTALSKIPDYTLDLVSLAGNVGLSLTGVQYASLSGVPYLETQSVSLGNHHIYGSSRLGIAQYQPLQFRYNWDYKYGLVNTFGLTKQRSWYSYLQNAPMNAGTTSAYGNQLDSVAEADHIIGQKQYELVNHLGNVQETVSDKKFSKDLNGDSTRDEYRAASVMVYDYYPFGMLMPGRSLDTAGLCVTRTTYQEVPHYNWVNGNALDGSGGGSGASAIGAASISAGSGTGVDVSGTGDGISFTISGITAWAIEVQPHFSYVSGTATVTVWQGTNTSSSGTQLGSKATGVVSPTIGIPVSAGGTSTSPATVTVVITMPTGSSRSLFNLDSIGYQTLTYTLATGTYTQCGDPVDKYEFEYDGKLKDNEIAGVGNHLDYGARSYDPRIAKWWTTDQHADKYPGVSPYEFALNSPLMYNDPDGKDVAVAITRNPQGGGGTIRFSSTVYVTGANVAAIVEASNKAFAAWKNNSGTTSDGKWQVQVQMTFIVATPDDVKRISNAKAEQAGENLLSVDLPTGGRAYAGIQSAEYSKSRGKKFQGAGNQGRITAADGGIRAIHENMHMNGLGDRYTDVTYEMRTPNGESKGRTGAFSKAHTGFEGDIMNKGWGMSQTHIDNLANKALEVSAEKSSDNFIMGRVVDNANNSQVDKVPSTYSANGLIYCNPQSPK